MGFFRSLWGAVNEQEERAKKDQEMKVISDSMNVRPLTVLTKSAALIKARLEATQKPVASPIAQPEKLDVPDEKQTDSPVLLDLPAPQPEKLEVKEEPCKSIFKMVDQNARLKLEGMLKNKLKKYIDGMIASRTLLNAHLVKREELNALMQQQVAAIEAVKAADDEVTSEVLSSLEAKMEALEIQWIELDELKDDVMNPDVESEGDRNVRIHRNLIDLAKTVLDLAPMNNKRLVAEDREYLATISAKIDTTAPAPKSAAVWTHRQSLLSSALLKQRNPMPVADEMNSELHKNMFIDRERELKAVSSVSPADADVLSRLRGQKREKFLATLKVEATVQPEEVKSSAPTMNGRR